MEVAYLVIGQLEPGLFAVGEDFPQNHPKAPHIAHRGELPIHDALRRHPADGQHGVTSDLKEERRRSRWEGREGGKREEIKRKDRRRERERRPQ